MSHDAASAEAQRFHAVVLMMLSDVMADAGDTVDAIARLDEAGALLRRLVEDNPTNPDFVKLAATVSKELSELRRA